MVGAREPADLVAEVAAVICALNAQIEDLECAWKQRVTVRQTR